jgi:T5SS/PEP-CTERM-associated repeat protein
LPHSDAVVRPKTKTLPLAASALVVLAGRPLQVAALPIKRERRDARAERRRRHATALRTALLASSALVAAALPAQSQTNWTGVTSTDWFTASNWDNGVPPSNGLATINTVTPNPTVVGGAPQIANANTVVVGESATGQLTIQDGGRLITTTGVIGQKAGSQGTATVTGVSTVTGFFSEWFTTNLIVGVAGSGTLTVENGGQVSSTTTSFVGSLAGSQGKVTVTGPGSGWSARNLIVGRQGIGELTVSNGGVVSSPGGVIGAMPGSQGTVTVTGAGSIWTNFGPGGNLLVGVGGTGSTGKLIIADGGAVDNVVGGVGTGSGSQGTVTVTGAGSTWTNSSFLVVGDLLGTGTLTIADGGTVSASTVTLAGGVGSTGTLNIGAAPGSAPVAPGTLSTPTVQFGDGTGTLNFNHTATNYVFAPAIGGTGSVNVLSGTTILTAANTYTGPTTVDGGALVVDGSIATSVLTSVNAGGTLAGTGTVGNTQINNGGTLAPGASIGTLTIQGNLVMASAAAYLIEVSPTNADRTNVTGTATLGGTVQAVLAPGSYTLGQSYTILSAAGGLGGSTFSGVSASAPNFSFGLGYTATDVVLTLTGAALGSGASLSGNQQAVAGAINGFFNSGGTLPPNFTNLFFLTGGNLANALTLLSGEAATGAQQGAFKLMDQFLGVMLDPFVDGRAPALGFAPDRPEMPDDIALAYSKVMRTPMYKAPPAIFEPRWSVWGAGYGGYNKTSGDPLVVGSHDIAARTAGFAAGMDYRLAPGTVAGFALAGGGTKWDLAQGLGSGRSDAFQAGVYAATRSGPWYLAGALAFANHWMSTDRFAPFGDHLTADFDAQSFGGRLEGGYRFGTPVVGVTPYAAVQAQSFRTPSYRETDVNGLGFGLAYDARTGSDTRSELGARFDQVAAASRDAVLTLRGRLAWAHDWVSDPTLAAVFQTLPGANFIVNGAVPAKDAALASAGVELRLLNGVTLLAKFDGEFASHAQTYAGTGSLRWTW